MKASVYEKYGSPEVLEIKNINNPLIKDTEILIKVYATTVNRTDCASLRAKPFVMRFFTGLIKPKVPVLGTDFAGIVEAVGDAVKSFNIGDKVFGFDDTGLQSHAQYMAISQDKAVSLMPKDTGFEDAVACLEGAHYAINILNKVKLNNKQKILVNGSTGAIGSATVQLLKYYGIHVTAVCKGQNIKLVKSLGADKVIDYLKEDFTQSNEKYDFIFDTVGKSSFNKCKKLLVDGGTYISTELGFMIQNPLLSLITPLFRNKKVVFPIPSKPKESVALVKKLIEEGKFKAVIDKTYPLEDISKAFIYVESGEKIGNVVIKMI